MVRVRVRHFNVVEAELKAAADEALRIAIPIRTAEGSGSGPGQKLQLASAGGASQNSTENRWLGRMVSNTLGEVRARADLHDNAGALLKEKVAAEAEEVEKLGESKKRKRAEVEELRKRLKAARTQGLKSVEAQCTSGLRSLRPETDGPNPEPAAAALPVGDEALSASAVLSEVASLHARAKRCAEELCGESEALAGRLESFRATNAAVESFLRSKPSRVEQAIKKSQQQQQQQQQQGKSEEREGNGGKSKACGGKSKAPASGISGISALADHVAPPSVKC